MTDGATAMSPPVTAGAGPSGSPGGRREPVASVADSFSELQRTVRRSKARLLAPLATTSTRLPSCCCTQWQSEGPMRASALAASVQADLSTVSRQVATLVGRGLLERQADQFDGRACLLAVTDAGRAAIAEHEQGRQTFFDAVLADWNTEEMRQFARQLERFTAAYDHVHTAWMSERARRPESHPRTTHPRQQP